MFPWSVVYGGSNWVAFNTVMSLVGNILSWDLIKGTLAACAAMVVIGYIIGRLKRLAGA